MQHYHELHYLCMSWVSLLFQINLIAPPLYVMTTSTLERTDGLEMLNKAIDVIKKTIEEADGIFNIEKAVCFYSPLHHTSYFVYIIYAQQNMPVPFDKRLCLMIVYHDSLITKPGAQ